MKLERVEVGQATGRVIAHRHPLRGRTLAKGSILHAEDVSALVDAGIVHIVVVKFGLGDLRENEAAERIASAAVGDGVRVGEVRRGQAELLATVDGVLEVRPTPVGGLNHLDDALTFSTLEPRTRVIAGDRIAVAKIIPLAVSEEVVTRGCAVLSEGGAVVRVRPFTPARAGLVFTVSSHTREVVLGKVAESIRARLKGLGSTLAEVRRCDHRADVLSEAIMGLKADGFAPIFVYGASSSMDRDDVLPVGVTGAGAELIRVGIPVEPGNQMLLATIGETHVLSVPACASSRNHTAFDVVLQRILSGLPVDRSALAELGVGGLLPGRRSARPVTDAEPEPNRVAAVVLAAGQSRRMGSADKMLMEVGGMSMVRRVIETAVASGLDPVVVVTGPDRSEVWESLEDLDDSLIERVINPRADLGMSGSVTVGVNALKSRKMAAAVILLGDMPLVRSDTIRALVSAYEPGAGVSACVPEYGGRRGNPVLWGAGRFDDLLRLSGDAGARSLLRRLDAEVREVPVEDSGILVDVDDAAALEAVRRRIDSG